jgi:hypothetical protein
MTTIRTFLGNAYSDLPENRHADIEVFTDLEQAVWEIVAGHADSYPDTGVGGFLADLQYGGCASGLVGELVSYHDTQEFYQTHKRAISRLVADTLSDYGVTSLGSLFGDKWDGEDPLAQDTQNQNLLTWFAFETLAAHIGGWETT